MLIFGTVIDQQQELGSGETFDQTVEKCLGLGIDPMQVFKHQHQRLYFTLTQQNPFESLQGPLASLGRIELEKRTVLRKDIQKK